MKLFTTQAFTFFTGALLIALTGANAATIMTLRTDDKLQTIEVRGMNTVYQFNVHASAGDRFGDLTNLIAGIGVERKNVVDENCVIYAKQRMLPNGINQFILRQVGDCYGNLGKDVSVAGYYNEVRVRRPAPAPVIPDRFTCVVSPVLINGVFGLDVKKMSPNGSLVSGFTHYLDQAVGEVLAMSDSHECVLVKELNRCYFHQTSIVLNDSITLTGNQEITAQAAWSYYKQVGVCRL